VPLLTIAHDKSPTPGSLLKAAVRSPLPDPCKTQVIVRPATRIWSVGSLSLAPEQRDEPVARGAACRVRAGMTRLADFIDLARCDLREPDLGAFGTPDRAVAIPDRDRHASEFCARGGDFRKGKQLGHWAKEPHVEALIAMTVALATDARSLLWGAKPISAVEPDGYGPVPHWQS
jgi:hypothetical protein